MTAPGPARRRLSALFAVAAATLAAATLTLYGTSRAASRPPEPTGTPTGVNPSPPAGRSVAPRPPTVLLPVAAQSQLPELPNGCEVTSLAMLLAAVGRPGDKMLLAGRQPVDPTAVSWRPGVSGQPDLDAVTFWGNPNVGFVGDVYARPGYGIYHQPLRHLLDQQLPGRALDLTGHPFADILAELAHGVPVLIWTTTSYAPTHHRVTWQSPTGPVVATPDEHAVLLVGYNHDDLFINDPLSGRAAVPVNPRQLQAAWQQLGAQALTVAA